MTTRRSWMLLVLVLCVSFSIPLLAQDDHNTFTLPELEFISAQNAAGLQQLAILDAGAGVAFSGDGQLLISGRNLSKSESVVRIWDVYSGYEQFSAPATGQILSLSAHPYDSTFVVGSSDGSATIWDMYSGGIVNTYFGHERPAEGASLSPNRVWMASVGDVVHVWNLDGQQKDVILQPDGYARTVAFSPGSRLVAYSVWDDQPGGAVYLWNLEDNNQFAYLPHPAKVNSIAYNPDNFNLITAADDGIIRFWDYGEQALYNVLPLGGRALSTAFSYDGSIFAGGSDNGTIQVWFYNDLEVFETPIATLYQSSAVTALAISPDGRLIASTGMDGITRLWGVPRPEPVPPSGIVHLTSYDGRISLIYPTAWYAEDYGDQVYVTSPQILNEDGSVAEDSFQVSIYIVPLASLQEEFPDLPEVPQPTDILREVVKAASEQGTGFTTIDRLQFKGYKAARVAVDDNTQQGEIWIVEVEGGQYLWILAVAPQGKFPQYQAPYMGILESVVFTPPLAEDDAEN